MRVICYSIGILVLILSVTGESEEVRTPSSEIADGEVQGSSEPTTAQEAAMSASASEVNDEEADASTAQIASMSTSALEGKGEKMMDSTKPGCTGVKCLGPREDQKTEGCFSLYPDEGSGLLACCPVWSCAKQNGEIYTNGSVSGSAGEFNSGSAGNQTLPPNVPGNLPPGSNVKYESQQETFSEQRPGLQSRGHTNSYSYSSSSSFMSSSSGTPGEQQMSMGMPMPMPIPMGG